MLSTGEIETAPLLISLSALWMVPPRLTFDFMILWKTLGAVVRGRGAY